MPIFITQGRFTHSYVTGMLAKPEDRLETVRKLGEAAGSKLISFYMTFGDYDFMLIAEGTAEGIAAGLIAAAAGGGITDLKTTMAMTTAEMKSAFEKASSVAKAYRAPG